MISCFELQKKNGKNLKEVKQFASFVKPAAQAEVRGETWDLLGDTCRPEVPCGPGPTRAFNAPRPPRPPAGRAARSPRPPAAGAFLQDLGELQGGNHRLPPARGFP